MGHLPRYTPSIKEIQEDTVMTKNKSNALFLMFWAVVCFGAPVLEAILA